MTPADERRCVETTTRGTRYRGFAVDWPHNLPDDPRLCGTHLGSELRAARTAAFDALHPELKALWERRARMYGGAPACWSWPVQPEHTRAALESATADSLEAGEELAIALLDDWQDSRCAVCGSNWETVTEHDHITGLVRGLLCRSCNTLEGGHQDAGHVWDRYRQLPPTLILGVRLRYFDPYLRRYAHPKPQPPEDDGWGENNPLIGIGL